MELLDVNINALSTGGVCDQQDNADRIINFAKVAQCQESRDARRRTIAHCKRPFNTEDIG
jgi:hypothetical protein